MLTAFILSLPKARLVPVLGFVAALGLLPATGFSQARTVSYEAKCAGCRIVREKVASLGSPDDSVLVEGTAQISRDSRGRFFVTGIPGRSVIVFDAAGKYTTAFGKSGQGPGEFSAHLAGILVGPGDSIYVFDVTRRVHIFTPSLRFVRSMALPAEFRRAGAVLNDGQIFIAAAVRTAESIGLPYHLFAQDGRLLRSFGASLAEVRQEVRQPSPGFPILRRDGAGIWSTDFPRYEYGMSSWSLQGVRQFAVEVKDVKWMAAAKASEGNAAVLPAYEDSAARLWVHGYVDDPGFRPIPGKTSQYGFTALSRTYDNIVDVFDTKTWTLLATARFDEYLWPLGSSGMVYSLRENADGIVTVDVWRLRLTQVTHSPEELFPRRLPDAPMSPH